ncbi:hypothetical protein F2Q69_00013680 [Brassica cretica]|uniref:Uncharacterized protein n=1 Tax=Brassica cretica TaxID=69181 RepID=A0A8S9R1J6_BRACR|nr:hypothetical protein F2Q69_00013680 [Brassica cretica]
MFCGSVSIDFRGGMLIDDGWIRAVDRRVISFDGGKRVSVDEKVMLSIDAVRPQLSLVGPKKVSIDSNNGVSIDTPFSPSIDTTTELSIDEPSKEHYRTGLTCSLGLTKSASTCF